MGVVRFTQYLVAVESLVLVTMNYRLKCPRPLPLMDLSFRIATASTVSVRPPCAR